MSPLTLIFKLILVVVLVFLTNSCIFYISNLGVGLIRGSKTKKKARRKKK